MPRLASNTKGYDNEAVFSSNNSIALRSSSASLRRQWEYGTIKKNGVPKTVRTKMA